MSNTNLTRTESGKYVGAIAGVAVRVVRLSVGENAYGERSKRAEWKVYENGAGCIADGNCTMGGAIAAAERSILARSAK